MSFDFHIEVVIGAGKPDDAATADYAATAAKPNQAVTAQRVNVDPKTELDPMRTLVEPCAAASGRPGSSHAFRGVAHLCTQFELPNGATVTPRVPPRSMNCCTAPEALASSTNSLA